LLAVARGVQGIGGAAIMSVNTALIRFVYPSRLLGRGVGLNALVGRRFLIGDVECVGRRLAEPCSHVQRLAPAGILAGLVHRGGLRADILAGGTIRVGDAVVPVPDA